MAVVGEVMVVEMVVEMEGEMEEGKSAHFLQIIVILYTFFPVIGKEKTMNRALSNNRFCPARLEPITVQLQAVVYEIPLYKPHDRVPWIEKFGFISMLYLASQRLVATKTNMFDVPV